LGNSAAAVALFILAVPSFLTAQQHSWRVEYEPAAVVNGSPVLFRVTVPDRLTALQGTWLEHQVAFRLEPKCHCWYAIAGVPLETHAGQYPLELEGVTVNGGQRRFSRTVAVIEEHYPSTAIKVAPEYVEPPRETLARIEEEQAVKKKQFSQTSADALWSGRFEPPARADVSGVFGSARVFNGVKRNQHTGIDFRVQTGTPIHAANAGAVVLARNLYFEGNCVAIDHGQGLITLYLHLSVLKVKEGDAITRGQVLGLSGATGRATAPHLHFAVRWQGTYLNPAILLKLTPP
jgi:murein DD-endopeptidase MepM/ murein hydrolase activator NlpD